MALAFCLSCILAVASETARLNRIGIEHYKNREFEQAEAAYRAALATAEESEIAPILSNLAALDKRTGRLPLALARYREVVERRERLLGRTHGDTGVAWNNVADILRGMQRYSEALQALEKALVCGLTAPDRAIVLNNRGAVLDLMGRWDEARDAYLMAIELHRNDASGAADLAAAYTNLAALETRQGRLDQAALLQERALRTVRSFALESSRAAMVAYFNQAAVLYRQSKHRESRKWIERSLRVAGGLGETDAVERGVLLANYAAILRKCGDARNSRKAEAESLALLPAAVRWTVPAGAILE